MTMLQLWVGEMPVSLVVLVVTAAGFLVYGIQVFVSPFIRKEFSRFGMTTFQRNATGSLQVLGASALVAGIAYPILGFMSACGFTIMMSSALIVRIRIKDTFIQSLPAMLLLLANIWLCFSFYYWINH